MRSPDLAFQYTASHAHAVVWCSIILLHLHDPGQDYISDAERKKGEKCSHRETVPALRVTIGLL